MLLGGSLNSAISATTSPESVPTLTDSCLSVSPRLIGLTISSSQRTATKSTDRPTRLRARRLSHAAHRSLHFSLRPSALQQRKPTMVFQLRVSNPLRRPNAHTIHCLSAHSGHDGAFDHPHPVCILNACCSLANKSRRCGDLTLLAALSVTFEPKPASRFPSGLTEFATRRMAATPCKAS